MRNHLLAFITFAGIATTPNPLLAGVPSPAQCTVPCLVACPAGDLPYVVTVRDIAGNPLANSLVTLQFCLDAPNARIESVPSFRFCCTGTACAPSPGTTSLATTGSDGRATLFVAGGGALLTQNSLVIVVADGIVLGQRDITTVDLDDDSVVGATDATLANGFLGSADPIADFDCSGLVDAADLAILSAHLGHTCHCPVPTRSTTWGRAKILYR